MTIWTLILCTPCLDMFSKFLPCLHSRKDKEFFTKNTSESFDQDASVGTPSQDASVGTPSQDASVETPSQDTSVETPSQDTSDQHINNSQDDPETN